MRRAFLPRSSHAVRVRVCVLFPFHQVTMADRSAADRACKDPNPIIDGRKANVNLAYLGAKPRVMQPGNDSQRVIKYREKYCIYVDQQATEM